MKNWFCLAVGLLLFSWAVAQSEENQIEEEQLLETVSENEASLENDGDLQELEFFRRHPLNLNKVTVDELKIFPFLSISQLENFFEYRSQLGKLIHPYELQAIPGWDKNTIQQILRFAKVGDTSTIASQLKEEWRKGEHGWLIRYGRNFGNDSETKRFQGDPSSLLFRYSYRYKNEFRFGITGDKDAGESFFRAPNRSGFDFYSAHLFVQPGNKLKAIALGDFTIQLGQGLVQWQGLAFGKSSETMIIKRQGPMLKPYTSSGEYNFHRGVGTVFGTKHWELLTFVSARKLSANLIEDSISYSRRFSSIQISGYHRTVNEIADKNRLSLYTMGAAVNYKFNKGKIGLNVIGYRFSDSLLKQDQPYNYFSFSGKRLMNLSIDGSATLRNFHFFGEAAFSQNFSHAIVTGLITALGGGLDFSVLYRDFQKSYYSFFSNSFSEGSAPNNERGLYLGLQYKLSSAWRWSVYADYFRNDWVKFGTSGPSAGLKYLVQLNFDPSKTIAFYLRFRNSGQSGVNQQFNYINQSSSLRFHFQQKLTRTWEWRNRIETNWLFDKNSTVRRGTVFFSECFFEPMEKPFATSLRILYFDTDGYGSRVYAFESDVLYSYNVPGFYGNGWRWVLNGKIKISQLIKFRNISNMTFWVKFAQTIENRPIFQRTEFDNQFKSNSLSIKGQLICTF